MSEAVIQHRLYVIATFSKSDLHVISCYNVYALFITIDHCLWVIINNIAFLLPLYDQFSHVDTGGQYLAKWLARESGRYVTKSIS